MNTEKDDAAIYHNAKASVLASIEGRRGRFEQTRISYDRFYDLVAQLGPAAATASLPEEAAVVAEFEKSCDGPSQQMDHLLKALLTSLETRMASLATASVMVDGSIVGRLRHDVIALGAFRVRALDGIDGNLWELLKQGHGVTRSEPNRMLNRVLATWCGVYEIKPLVLHKAVLTIGLLPDAERYGVPAGVPAVFEKHAAAYPFDLASDLAEVRTWGEKDVVFIDAVLAHHDETGDWNPVARSAGWSR